MRLSSIVLALVGLGVAGGSAQLAREMMTAPKAEASVEQALVQAMVAAVEIRRGDPIQPHMLVAQNWPREALPPGAFTSFSALLPAEPGGEPRRAVRPMVAGEIILASKVSNFGEKVTIVDTLSPGTRAVAIRVDAVTAVGGFVTPGDFVDIFLTRGQGEALITDNILRNIRVIAIDQSADELADRPALAATITVEVTAEQAQVLALGQRAGTLSLALRDPNAKDTAPIDRLRLSDLVPEEAPPEAEAPEAPARNPTIIIRRGIASEEVPVRN
jgi:pilus assembly protein CpaB